MTGNRKAIALDLDGTLLRNDHTISDFTVDMLHRCAAGGWVIIIATARPVRTIKQVLPTEFEEYYWAAMNGAWVLRNGELLKRDEIAEEMAMELLALCRRQGYRFSLEANDWLYSNIAGISAYGWQYHDIAEFTAQPICKLLIDTTQDFDEAEFQRLAPANCHYMLTDQGKLLQLAATECSKLAAVRYIADREGVAFADVVAFGDDNNDIPLLQAAGLGVAMLNATAELKAVANMVGMSNEEEGVGKVLEWLLEGGGSQ